MLIADPFSSTCRPVLTGNRGAVSAAHPLAVSAGIEMLLAGGSAADATIAAQAVICVLSPDNCGLGGDQLCLVRTSDGTVMAVNGTGAAPRNMNTADIDGGNSVTVPGVVDAWVIMSERWGRLPLARTLEPAIRTATDGFIIGERLAETSRDYSVRLIKGGAERWAMRTAPAGSLQRQPELATLLTAIGREGRDAFYAREMANAITSAIARAGGTLDQSDLADHRTAVGAPLTTSWRGHTVHVQPPVSQGVLLSMVLAAEERQRNLETPQRDHVGVELTESSFAFRDRSCDGAALLDEPLHADIERASRRGGPRAYLHTAGVAVADASGMTISSLISVFDSFGSAVFVPEGGFTLNNRAAGFTHAPNECAGGKRPVHTLAPVLVETDNGCIALATPGADGQVQTLLQVLSNVFIEGDDVATAIARPRWRSQDSKLLIERSHRQRENLASRGHDVVVTEDGDLRFGAIVCAGLTKGRPFCCADWRRETWCGVA